MKLSKLSFCALALVVACGGGSKKSPQSDGVNNFSEEYNPKACEGTSTVSDLIGKKWFVFNSQSQTLDLDGSITFEQDSMTFDMKCSDGSLVSVKSATTSSTNSLQILEDKEVASPSEPGCISFISKSDVTFKVEGKKLTMCDPEVGNATLFAE